ncbi:hypothetical protein [Streptomyces halobius]|uniref:Uncharacterized protein n=1 Tax=Streptomyces halobius TaxID=2879846 RepID=A0ABY4M0E5_9ACTN|nr:hypothetical protein [Streptomyces halobius]UQA91221.1 hypothetical protein K9S39_04425 [Streptomyces halobius]
MADTVTIPADVAHAFTNAWCGRLTSDVAAALNCAEVETLAELLRAGAEQAADEWIDAHADGDEPGEEHFQGPVPDEVPLAADGYRCTTDDLTDTKE